MWFCLSRRSLPVILVSSEFIKVSIIDTFLVFVRKLMFLKYSCQKPLKKNCGRPVFLEEWQTARNFSKVSMHFNKIPKYLTLSGLCFFENLKKTELGGRPSRPTVKKHAVSQTIFVHFTWNFVHILYWQYGISLDKKIDKCHFCHHLMTSSWKSCVDVF